MICKTVAISGLPQYTFEDYVVPNAHNAEYLIIVEHNVPENQWGA